MTIDEYTAIEAELLRTIDDCEYAASCVRASLGNLYNAVKYPLSDARVARGATANAHDAVCRAVDMLATIQDKEKD
jgi:hypothetical protein